MTLTLEALLHHAHSRAPRDSDRRAHGWAEKIPTWRWDGSVVRRLFGKPVTGYHVCLVTRILLFLHVPQFYRGSWEREADLLAMFFFLTVTWDFLWFACKRHFGVARFRKG